MWRGRCGALNGLCVRHDKSIAVFFFALIALFIIVVIVVSVANVNALLAVAVQPRAAHGGERAHTVECRLEVREGTAKEAAVLRRDGLRLRFSGEIDEGVAHDEVVGLSRHVHVEERAHGPLEQSVCVWRVTWQHTRKHHREKRVHETCRVLVVPVNAATALNGTHIATMDRMHYNPPPPVFVPNLVNNEQKPQNFGGIESPAVSAMIPTSFPDYVAQSIDAARQIAYVQANAAPAAQIEAELGVPEPVGPDMSWWLKGPMASGYADTSRVALPQGAMPVMMMRTARGANDTFEGRQGGYQALDEKSAYNECLQRGPLQNPILGLGATQYPVHQFFD